MRRRCFVTDAHSPLADIEVKHFADAFKLKMADKPEHFLGANIDIESPTRIKLSSRAYVAKMAATYLPKPLAEYRTYSLPSSKDILASYERAVDGKGTDVCPKLAKSYPSKVGAMIYAPACSRLDAAFTVNMCARCLAFPTAEMDAHADRCIAYMAQHADYGLTFDAGMPNASRLVAYSDSSWDVTHSTTGFGLMYGGAAVEYCSKRQVSISVSSTEAEIMAASTCALEILYYRGLLSEMGVDVSEPTILYVDNSGAIELSKHQTSCKRSRHIQRRWLKLRELVAEGHIDVRYIATAENPSDMLTKPLAQEPFDKHRVTLMGRGANN